RTSRGQRDHVELARPPRRFQAQFRPVHGSMVAWWHPRSRRSRPSPRRVLPDRMCYSRRSQTSQPAQKMEAKMATALEQVMHLSAEEKLDLISALWESMAEHPERIPVPDGQVRNGSGASKRSRRIRSRAKPGP